MHAELALAQEFIGSHPAEAARVLETLPARELLELFNTLPAPLAAECLKKIALSKRVEALSGIAVEQLDRILEAMQAHEVAAALRPMTSEQRNRLLESAPPRLAEPARRLLRYPEGTAGSLMDPEVPSLPADISVVEARSLLRGASLRTMYYVYIVDRNSHLTGVVNLRQLMLTSSKQSLESLMRRPVTSIPSAAGRAAIIRNPAWRDLHALPVVDEAGRFLGALRHETVRRLEADTRTADPSKGTLGTALAIGELCWVVWSRVIGGVGKLAVAGPAPRHARQEGERDEGT